MFEVGDKVRCIDSKESIGCLSEGCIYTVSAASGGNTIKLEGLDWNWSEKRFELVKEEPMKLEIGKKYHKKTNGNYGKVVYCVGFTQSGRPVVEFETGSIYSTENKGWEEYVEPKSGTHTVYIYGDDSGNIFSSNADTKFVNYKLLATKEVKWTEGDKK